jgi:dienelactone hydrolase
MNLRSSFCSLLLALVSTGAFAAVKDIQFYSEGVVCYGKLFIPDERSDVTKLPAVLLAPGARQTVASLEAVASAIAARGLIAMTFDYRGWGKSGGLLYFGEPVRTDDRLRFSQTTTTMLIRRKRLEPSPQLIDIRNAITYLQGESNVDRARIGVWGTDLSADHAIVVAGTDARVKAVVAQAPSLNGGDLPRKAFLPTAEQQASMVRLARAGAAPTNDRAANAMNSEQSKLALAEYRPFWYLEQIAPTTAVRFVLLDKALDRGIAAQTDAARKLLKGPADVVKVTESKDAVAVAAEWFAKNL